jgi:hypothetical protein
LKIKEKAGEKIAFIAPYLNEDDRGNTILPTVLSMAHDEINEENKIVSVQVNKFNAMNLDNRSLVSYFWLVIDRILYCV